MLVLSIPCRLSPMVTFQPGTVVWVKWEVNHQRCASTLAVDDRYLGLLPNCGSVFILRGHNSSDPSSSSDTHILALMHFAHDDLTDCRSVSAFHNRCCTSWLGESPSTPRHVPISDSLGFEHIIQRQVHSATRSSLTATLSKLSPLTAAWPPVDCFPSTGLLELPPKVNTVPSTLHRTLARSSRGPLGS
jgi:hypothetical protein